MNTNRFLDPDDRLFVNIRVHSWLNFLSNLFLNIEGENAVSANFDRKIVVGRLTSEVVENIGESSFGKAQAFWARDFFTAHHC
jgi:hypothetical protein